MNKKLFACVMFFVFILGACATTNNTDNQMEETKEEMEQETENDTDESVEEAEVNIESAEEESLAEPAGTMESWPTLSPEEKLQIVKESIEYEKATQEQKGSPVVVNGSPEEFVKVIDERYEEIDGFEGFERYRMMNSSIAAQVSIMGHQSNLFEFSYNQD